MVTENFINGEFKKAGGTFTKISPIDEAKLGEVANSNEADVKTAVASARAAFAGWSRTSSIARADYLFKVGELLVKNTEELAHIVHLETGKSKKDARGEIFAAVEQARFMASEGYRMEGRVIPGRDPNKTVMLTRAPVGVCALIVAFNTPVANFAWKVFPALICGNTCVLKTSEDTPQTALFLARLVTEAGVPAGVLNVIHGQGAQAGQALVTSSDVDLISFTGSTAVGRTIEQSVAGRLRKVFLELGGKNPLVICDDADLENALKWALASSFSNAGQRCASSSRIYVQQKMYEKFTSEFVARTKKLKIGSGDADDLGPVINSKAMNTVLLAGKAAVSDGAEILCGGARSGNKGFYLEPTIVAGAKLKSDISQKEIFGPLTTVSPFKTLDEAVELANGTEYGLTASIHTPDMNKAMSFAKRVQAGLVNFNIGTHGSEAHFPFGGVKASGNGLREPGVEALDVYSNVKNICINFSYTEGTP